MQNILQVSTSPRTGPIRVVDSGRLRSSRAAALRAAHASLAAAEENLRHLTARLARAPGGRPAAPRLH